MILLTAALAAAAIVLASPRVIAPEEMPGLAIDPEAARRLVRADDTHAASAPAGEVVDEIATIYAELGRLEKTGQSIASGDARRMRDRMVRGVAAIRTEHGDAGVDALRARATGLAERALTSGATGEEADGLLGGFEAFLDQYSARRDGRLSAPPLVVRSLFKARWNAVHGLAPTTGLAPLELEAYWGWLALEATEVDPARRLDALAQYHRVAERSVPEAEATLLYLVGDGPRAAALFAEIQRQRGTNLRLRNHELAALALSVE